MADPLGLFPDDANSDPLGLFNDAPAVDENAPGLLRSFASSAGSELKRTAMQKARGMAELGLKTAARIPAGTGMWGGPAAYEFFSGQKSIPTQEQLAAFDSGIEDAIAETYDPAIRASSENIAQHEAVNPLSSRAGSLVGMLGGSVPAMVMGPSGLALDMGAQTLGANREQGKGMQESLEQAAIMGTAGALIGRAAPAAFHATRALAPFASPAANYATRLGALYALGQGTNAGIAAANALGPTGSGNPLEDAVAAVNDPVMAGASLVGGGLVARPGLNQATARRLVKPARDTAVAQALPQPDLTQRMIAGVPSPEMMAVGAERAPIPFPTPEPAPVARRRLVEVEPARPMPEDAGLRPVEVPGEVPEIANRPAQQSPLAPERPGRPFLAESLPDRAMPEPPPAKPLPPESTGTLLDILAPLDLPPAAKQQVQAALEAAGVQLPETTTVLPREGQTGLRQVPDVKPPELPVAKRQSFNPATEPELPPIQLEGDAPPVARNLGPVTAEPTANAAKPAKVPLPEILPEVPRVQEAPRPAQPTTEVRPAVDPTPAPTVETAPVETQAAPAPRFGVGDTVNILAPNGKPAVKSVRVLSVDETAGTVKILNRSTGKAQELPIERIEPVQKPVAKLIAKPVAEAPVVDTAPEISPERKAWLDAKAAAKPDPNAPKAPAKPKTGPDEALSALDAEAEKTARRAAVAQDFIAKKGGNNARRGAVGVGGGRTFGGSPDVLDTAIAGAKIAGKAIGKGVAAVTRGAAILSRDARMKMRDAKVSQKILDLAEETEQEAVSIRQDPKLLVYEQRNQLPLAATKDFSNAINPQVPNKNYTGEMYSPLQMVLEGKAGINTLPKSLHNWVKSSWGGAERLAEIAKGVPGVTFAETPGGKVLFRAPGRDLIRMVNQGGEDYQAWLDTQAKKPGAPPIDVIRKAVNDYVSVMDRGEGVISKTSMETFRAIKDMAHYWAHNGKRMEIISIRPNRYLRPQIENVARRIPFIRRFGAEYDPTAKINEDIGHPLLDKTQPISVQKDQAEALQSWMRAVHGIDIGRDFSNNVRSIVDRHGGNKIRVALKEGGEVVMPIVRGAALSASQLANTLGHAASTGMRAGSAALSEGHLGPVVDWATAYGKVFSQEARNRIKGVADLPQHFYNMGDERIVRAAANVVGKSLEAISRPFDRATAYHAAFYAESIAQRMAQKKLNNYSKSLHVAEMEAMGIPSDMAQRMANGEGTKAEYANYVDNFINRFTGQSGSDVKKSALMRVSPFKAHLAFQSFISQQFRNVTQHAMLAAQDGRSLQTRLAHLQKFAEITTGLALGGAATNLAWEWLRSGNVDQTMENPGAAAVAALASGFNGSTMQALMYSMGKDDTLLETAAKLSLPIGITYKVAEAAKKSYRSMSVDPLFQMAMSATPIANKGRDFLGWAAGLDTGKESYSRRQALNKYYNFTKQHQDLMASKMPENYTAEITPLSDAIRKLSKSQYGDSAAIVAALKAAGAVGKDEADVAQALKNKRVLSKFSAKTRVYAMAKLREAIGPTAFRELLLHDMLLESLADRIK